MPKSGAAVGLQLLVDVLQPARHLGWDFTLPKLGCARHGDQLTWYTAVGAHVPNLEASALLPELLFGSDLVHDADALYFADL
ncbi:hypothetical protein Nepgr_008086 [Nepenthes gracilis]|uniref:Uncharacterized protein n=1 Tax=Nepenthes gracilis TaxID=150966 RepID=A0AAD3S8Y3_NEPGR|nr:hypothetical protein Nepgr_008086 [Nepenthes gracilis]